MKLCLNMIVRNESARIERCLKSVLPYITSYAIVDTGSTDNTIALIKQTLESIPGVTAVAPFVHFMQARNEALNLARAQYPRGYHLLLDADMELVVEDPTCFDGLTGASYDIIQKAGALSYHNRRLVRADQTGLYRGVTHEYLDVASAGCLRGVHFVDHADGSNRKDKFQRDIDLLLADLRNHPSNERSWFYLAQSYRDNGEPAKAAQAYRRRFEMGGWDEEVWNARVNYAHCLNEMGDEGGFVREMLAAYNFRPSRAETLYDLAKHFREKGQNHASLLFSEPGMAIPRSTDSLFINDHVYQTGLKEEFAICSFYDENKRDHGARVINDLMLAKHSFGSSRDLAKSNSFFYIKSLKEWAPSFKAKRIDFTPPDGYTAMNPSIVNYNGMLFAVVRTVNYTITADGRYEIRGGDGSITNDNPINTRNFLIELRPDLSLAPAPAYEVTWERPEALFKPVIGLEDMRLFMVDGNFHFSACVREQNEAGWCEQVTGRLGIADDDGNIPVVEWSRMLPEHRQNEKNWMPFVTPEGVKFVYRLGTVISDIEPAKIIEYPAPPLFTDTISGGSQLVSFYGGFLAVVHEARYRPDGQRYYQHRFAKFNAVGDFIRLSMPFVLHDKQIEFAAGMCWDPATANLLISYGVRDEEAWVASVSSAEVEGML